MYTITMDRSRCKKDGLCARVCPADVFVQREKLAIPELTNEQDCIACGHCVAVCPQNVIEHSEFPSTTTRAIQFEQMPTTDQVLELIKSRRSIRAFRNKPVAKDTIETIIDGARFAPSGHNSQSTEFLVVQDKAVLNKVSALVIEYLKFEIKRFANPLFRTMALLADRNSAESGLHEIPGFKQMIQMFESGADLILKGAPVLLAFHARQTDGYGDVNAQLALQNASLVAHALGIGHFYTGWVLAPCRAPMARAWNRRMPSLLGIPSENNLYGALALGHPIPRFKNIIERKPPRIDWV
ncbi:MAG: 4Fe-4S dicluster domain-containing protein [Chloroflexi bacterium]|nr:MAG: 4Fe-4S dicluster domain-containing protein [Chloroflexota bacterium]